MKYKNPLTRRILSILLLILCGATAHGQLIAGFTVSPAAGCAPLVVAFTNTTTPAAGTTYSWDLGNSTGLITLTNPGTSYVTAGTYTVTLTATHSGVSNTHTQVITVYPAPVVSFTVSDTAMCPGVPSTFTSTSTGGVPGPISYLWSFGDGFTATTSSFTHPYSIPGHFNITLNATNFDGCISTLTLPAYVHVFTPPVPDFSASPTYICHPPGNIVFTSAPVGTPPFTYHWTFGNGSPSSALAGPTHTYSSPDSFTVQLTVTDGHSCEDSNSMPGLIFVSGHTASFTYPDSVCLNAQASFTNTSSLHTNSLWTFGNGDSSIVNSSHYTYRTPGAYTVTLVTYDGLCYDTVSHPIVIPAPITVFTINPVHPCPAPATTVFAASVPPASTVMWYFGDSSSAVGNPVTHTYLFTKFDTIVMIATSDIGCRDTVTHIDPIFDLIPGITHPFPFVGAKKGCVPLSVTFLPQPLTSLYYGVGFPNYPYGLSSYTWNFGDGSPPTALPAPTHIYTAVGIYYASMPFVTGNGCIDTAYDTISVGTPPTVTFTATPRHECYNNNEVVFTRTLISGPANGYYWLFGEGYYSVYDTTAIPVANITRHFIFPGTFTDTLISFYNGCPDTTIRKNYIVIDPPMSKIHAVVSCSPENTVVFTDSSIGDDSHTWFFGDSTASTLANPVHTYSSPTTYTVSLTTFNNSSGCRDTSYYYINLSRPVITFSTPDTAVCMDTFLLFTPTISGEYAQYFRWLGGGGNFADNSKFSFIDTFHTPGFYTISFVTLDGNLCPDTTTRTNYILVSKPSAHFTVSPSSVCWPGMTTFTDASTDVKPGTPFTNFNWVFGDGTTAVSATPSVAHTFTVTGLDTTTEIVTDIIGCKDTVTLAILNVYEPKAAFAASTIHPCLFNTVSFNNTSTPAASYYWSFGDGSTSALASPSHIYTTNGIYSVTLIITDAHGCRDTATKISYLTVTRAHASFSMDDSISVCSNFVVHFTNTSSSSLGSFSNNWHLSDSSNSIAINPTNIYTSPGYDTVKLVVTNTYGCKDSATRHVKIFGYPGDFSYTPDSGCAPFTVFFNADAGSAAGVTSIIWDFGDGVTSPASLLDTISHTYSVPNFRVPKLIISDTGCESHNTGIDTIRIDGVQPAFTATPNPVCLGDSVILADSSYGLWSPVTHWQWTYNGVTDTLASPAAVTYTAIGTYTVTLQATDGWGCSATASKNVRVYSIPRIVISPDSMICLATVAALNDSDTGGTWSSGNVAVGTIDATGILRGIAAGIAPVTYTLAAGCIATAAVTINPVPDPGIPSGNPGLCLGATMVLSDTVAGGAWTVSNNSATITSAGVLTGVVPGFDTVSYTVTNGYCDSTAAKMITVYPLPDPGKITGNAFICKDSSFTLSETIAGGKWNSDTAAAVIDSITGVIKGVALGTTIITYTTPPDANGCINATTFPVAVTTLVTTASVTRITCYGSNNGSIAVSAGGGSGLYQYAWSNMDSSPSVNNLAPGQYIVKVKDLSAQCSSLDSFVLTQPDSLQITVAVKNDYCNSSNGSISADAAGGIAPYQFQWSGNTTGNQLTGLSAGSYMLTLSDSNACVKKLPVTIIDTGCMPIIIHNGISPNGDGINDTWVIERIQDYPANEVKVFDKWGDQVFEATNYKNDWGGTGKNGLLPDGTYYYLIKLNANNYPGGKDVFTGALLIKR